MFIERKYAWYFAFALLGVYAILIAGIAFSHVEEKTSFGLVTVINGLLLITEKFGAWLFNQNRSTTKHDSASVPEEKNGAAK